MNHLIAITAPIRTASLNVGGHWTQRAKRARGGRRGAWIALQGVKPPGVLPVAIHLVRIATRPLDGDNAIGALKPVRDGVADWLGADDGHPLLTWTYGQERGLPHSYGVRIEVRW